MTTPAEMVREFHEAFGVPLPDSPGIPSGDVEALRFELLREEYQELTDALATGDLVQLSPKRLADLVYVTYLAVSASPTASTRTRCSPRCARSRT
jgi:predicted HAD superfamily Cof-like phosphohydrolase